MADPTMPALPAVRNYLMSEPDLLRGLVEQTVNALLSEQADALCGAGWGERSAERTNQRNGYRERRWDTRAGTIDLNSRSSARAASSPTGCSTAAVAPRRR
jgi:transposase-like protein